MKRTRKILTVTIMTIIAITMLLAVLFTNTVSNAGGSFAWTGLWTNDPGHITYYKEKRLGFIVTEQIASANNNVYCIAREYDLKPRYMNNSTWHGQSNLYNVTAVITIDGSPEGTGTVKYYGNNDFKFGTNEGVGER